MFQLLPLRLEPRRALATVLRELHLFALVRILLLIETLLVVIVDLVLLFAERVFALFDAILELGDLRQELVLSHLELLALSGELGDFLLALGLYGFELNSVEVAQLTLDDLALHPRAQFGL